MNLVTPYAKLTAFTHQHTGGTGSTGLSQFTPTHGIALLQKIEWCARISHRSEDKQTSDSWNRFLTAAVLEHGDWSVTEHASVTVDFLVDRGITHEIVRHRLMSFTQESTRFVNYEKKMPASFIDPFQDNTRLIDDGWDNAIITSENAYRNLVANKTSPQIARSVLPNALASRIIVTANLRSWRHFLIMRTTRESHPQMREVTIPLLAQFQECIPLLFADITPNDKQSEAIKKAR